MHHFIFCRNILQFFKSCMWHLLQRLYTSIKVVQQLCHSWGTKFFCSIKIVDIMWEHEPVTAARLVKLCQDQLGWKRTTTYTVIKRLGERGVLKNDNGTVTSLVSKDEAQACEIDELVEKKFEGSLPAFIAAFTKHQAMSEDDLDEVQRMIDRIRKGGSQ